jgi:phage shock protein A
MNIFRDILTAIKGGASEVGEAIVDSQALRILEQEIRDAENGIAKAKEQLRNLKSREIRLGRNLAALKSDETGYTEKAKACKEKGDLDLARECAEKVLELRGNIAEEQAEYDSLATSVAKIYKVIESRQKTIDKNKNELEKAKTINELNKVKSAVASAMPTNDSSAKRVNRALERVKSQQVEFDDNQDADQWLSDLEAGSDLDAKLANVGIGGKGKTSADDFLKNL